MIFFPTLANASGFGLKHPGIPSAPAGYHRASESDLWDGDGHPGRLILTYLKQMSAQLSPRCSSPLLHLSENEIYPSIFFDFSYGHEMVKDMLLMFYSSMPL